MSAASRGPQPACEQFVEQMIKQMDVLHDVRAQLHSILAIAECAVGGFDVAECLVNTQLIARMADRAVASVIAAIDGSAVQVRHECAATLPNGVKAKRAGAE